ncbi:MAG: hypothetical protein ACOZDD_09370 [Bacteroidota bacterium]
MKEVIFISIILANLLLGCRNISSEYRKANSAENELINCTDMDAVSSVLIQKIKGMIAYNDSIDKVSSIKADVFIVFFSQENAGCYVTIFQSLNYYKSFYPSTLSSPSIDLEGYILLKDKMVAFYNLGSECNTGLVDCTKLEKDNPDVFPDENSDIVIHTTYDPRGKRFRIHSKDSLELVFSGYL